MNYLQNVNSKFTFCMQFCSCSQWSEVRGDLAEEKKLLSLDWSEVGGGFGRGRREADGGVGAGGGAR